MEKQGIKETDRKVCEELSKLFPGYVPSPLVDGEESAMMLSKEMKNGIAYRYELSVSNAAHHAGETNVDIGNSALANSLHERAHDLVMQLALKRAGITDLNNITAIQNYNFGIEKRKIATDVYTYCFSNESEKEIRTVCKSEISERSSYSGCELIAESIVQYLGDVKYCQLSKKVYNYIAKEWRR